MRSGCTLPTILPCLVVYFAEGKDQHFDIGKKQALIGRGCLTLIVWCLGDSVMGGLVPEVD
jgi:hypothetical protein